MTAAGVIHTTGIQPDNSGPAAVMAQGEIYGAGKTALSPTEMTGPEANWKSVLESAGLKDSENETLNAQSSSQVKSGASVAPQSAVVISANVESAGIRGAALTRIRQKNCDGPSEQIVFRPTLTRTSRDIGSARTQMRAKKDFATKKNQSEANTSQSVSMAQTQGSMAIPASAPVLLATPRTTHAASPNPKSPGLGLAVDSGGTTLAHSNAGAPIATGEHASVHASLQRGVPEVAKGIGIVSTAAGAITEDAEGGSTVLPLQNKRDPTPDLLVQPSYTAGTPSPAAVAPQLGHAGTTAHSETANLTRQTRNHEDTPSSAGSSGANARSQLDRAKELDHGSKQQEHLQTAQGSRTLQKNIDTGPLKIDSFNSESTVIQVHKHDPVEIRGSVSAGTSMSAASTVVTSKDTFAALDAGGATGTLNWVHAGTRQAEAGFQDPSLGWVSVRAQLNTDGIHASLVPNSTDAAQALGGHLTGLNSFMTAQHTPLQTLTVSTPENGWAGQTAGQGAGHGSGQGQGAYGGEHQEVRSGVQTSATAERSLSSASQTISSSRIFNRISSGTHISVLA
jgi:hypothetical protein